MKKLIFGLFLILPAVSSYAVFDYCGDEQVAKGCRERKMGNNGVKCVCPKNTSTLAEESVAETAMTDSGGSALNAFVANPESFHFRSDYDLPPNFQCDERKIIWDIGPHQYSGNESVFLEAKVSSKKECMRWVLSVLEEYEMQPAQVELDISGSDTRYVTEDTACTTNRRTGERRCHKTGTYSTRTVYRRNFKCEFHGQKFNAKISGEVYSKS